MKTQTETINANLLIGNPELQVGEQRRMSFRLSVCTESRSKLNDVRQSKIQTEK